MEAPREVLPTKLKVELGEVDELEVNQRMDARSRRQSRGRRHGKFSVPCSLATLKGEE